MKNGSGWGIAAACLLGWAAAASLPAQPLGFMHPEANVLLEPGTTVEVAWTLDPASAAFDEMELVLSLDGGRTFPLRLTRDIAPSTRRVLWRVPALATMHARLALRTGSNEDSETEAIRLVGPEFGIDARGVRSLEEVFRVRGEWRTREALGSSADLPERSLGDLPTEEVRSAFAHERAIEAPRTAGLVVCEKRHAMSSVGEASPGGTESALGVPRPVFIPLRQ